ncbi:MAG: hypothetical protein RMK57_09235 [Bryobacterales bacterium]|nr:hypothetical protein [Bryobacteraceae bacterium]MDW8354699.1 hypothetical protein [Bryobacterales bacterium]
MERVTFVLCYLDPASGSLTYQILVGGVLAVIAGVRAWWRKLLWWRRNKPPG